MSFNRIILFMLAIILFLANKQEAKVYKVFFLGGQSNMTGYGYVKELPPELNATFKYVMIYEGNSTLDCSTDQVKGIWTKLQPGHGEGFKTDGTSNKYSDRFGVELSFARQLLEMFPDQNIALIKYSRSGSSIDISAAGEFGCWEPDFDKCNGINQYDHALETISKSLAQHDIDGDGENDILIPTGIIWMQGESDATITEEVAKKYSSNLKRIIDLLRAALRIDRLPVVIGRISDSCKGDLSGGHVWKYGDLVREQQMSFIKQDKCAAIVTSTDNYNYSDKWHYDSEGYIDLGKQFAMEMYKLLTKNTK